MYWPIGVVVVTVVDGVVVIAVPLTMYVNKYGDWKKQVNIILSFFLTTVQWNTK